MNNIIKLIIALVISELAGAVGVLFTVPSIPSWYAGLTKPELAPPNWVFGPVWTVLYALMGIALYLVWRNDWEVKNRFLEGERKAWNKWSERLWTGNWQKANAIAVFTVQYALNIAWSYLFFDLRSPGLAFFGLLALWLAIFWTITAFYRISKPAAYLLMPYLIWVGFAGYLNYSIWMLNGNQPTALPIQNVKTIFECKDEICLKKDLIRVESPKPGEEISSPLQISGEARGNWFFEASFPIVLVDWDGRIIAQGIAAAQSEWMTTDFVQFKTELEFKKPEFIGDFSKRGALILKKDNPSGLPQNEDVLEVPVIFK